MPTIAAGSSATFSIPIGQVANVTGQGIAVLVYPTSSPIALTGNSVIGPFPVTRIVNVTASVGGAIDYTVAAPATGGGSSAALGISAKPTITTPAVAGTSISGAFSVVGTPTPSTAIQWLLDGVAISGATAIPYTSQSSDGGKALTLRVTATNTFGTLVSTSDPVTLAAAPVNPYARFQAAMAAVSANTGYAKIGLLGDSTQAGARANGNGQAPVRIESPVVYTKDEFNRVQARPAIASNFIGDQSFGMTNAVTNYAFDSTLR